MKNFFLNLTDAPFIAILPSPVFFVEVFPRLCFLGKTLTKGTVIAQLDPDFQITFPGQHMETRPTKRVAVYTSDGRLDNEKQEEVDKLPRKFSDMYWKPGDRLPSVKGFGKRHIRL